MTLARTLSRREQELIGELRQADEIWLPARELTRRLGLRHSLVLGAIRTLRRRELVQTRAYARGMPDEIEVAFTRSRTSKQP